jgi:hypothetical protein
MTHIKVEMLKFDKIKKFVSRTEDRPDFNYNFMQWTILKIQS